MARFHLGSWVGFISSIFFIITIMDQETNPKIIKRRRLKDLLSCNVCPPNKGENRKTNNQYHKKHKSWKILRKSKFHPDGRKKP